MVYVVGVGIVCVVVGYCGWYDMDFEVFVIDGFCCG